MHIDVKNDEMLGRTNENLLHIELIKKDKEIERLHNIIKEIRHLVRHNDIYDYRVYDEKLLEILDKENKND